MIACEKCGFDVPLELNISKEGEILCDDCISNHLEENLKEISSNEK